MAKLTHNFFAVKQIVGLARKERKTTAKPTPPPSPPPKTLLSLAILLVHCFFSNGFESGTLAAIAAAPSSTR
jgi:hypothetical protein